MKKSAKLAKLLLVGLMTIGLAACQSQAEKGTAEPAQNTSQSPKASEVTEGEMLKIGIVQPVEHMALDEARKGFIAALSENGFDDSNVEFDMQNGQGDTSNLSTICDRFVSQDADLVLAIATDSAQAMAAKSTEIPIIATAVTSFTGAGLVDSDEIPGGNVTGTSDMNPVAQQIKFLKDLVPGVQTIGLIYNSSEDNSVLQIDIAKGVIEAECLKWEEVTVVNSNDIQQAMQSLTSKCQAVYVPTDNTVASAMPTIHGIAMESKIPVICGEENAVKQGGLATMGINYFDLGYQAGEMAVDVLNGADITTMPVQYAASSDNIFINGTVAEEIGFTVPEKFEQFVVFPEKE